MQLLPYRQETFVLPYAADEAIRRLHPRTRPVEEGIQFSKLEERSFLFNGLVLENRFRISRRVQKPENFLPLLVGSFESTSVGSLLFVRYRLFFSTAMYLVFWTVICLLLSLFFLIFHQAWLYAAIAFGTGCVQYVVAIKNFSFQVKRSRQELEKVLFSREA